MGCYFRPAVVIILKTAVESLIDELNKLAKRLLYFRTQKLNHVHNRTK